MIKLKKNSIGCESELTIVVRFFYVIHFFFLIVFKNLNVS